jgi:uncharacterized membrane protein required for colicin V production
MDLKEVSVSWVDLLIVGFLVVGIIRGRKRGMSEELLDIIKWTLIVLVAGLAYEPTGRFLAQNTVFSLLGSYVTTYLAAVLFLLGIFSFVKQRIGDKLVGSDFFGSAEYYLGMAAGAYRYACVILVFMAMLNARYFSPADLRAQEAFQNDNFGSIRFPTLAQTQQEVFKRSFFGKTIRQNLQIVLVRPTAPTDKAIGGDGSAFRRRQFNEMLDKR